MPKRRSPLQSLPQSIIRRSPSPTDWRSSKSNNLRTLENNIDPIEFLNDAFHYEKITDSLVKFRVLKVEINIDNDEQFILTVEPMKYLRRRKSIMYYASKFKLLFEVKHDINLDYSAMSLGILYRFDEYRKRYDITSTIHVINYRDIILQLHNLREKMYIDDANHIRQFMNYKLSNAAGYHFYGEPITNEIFTYSGHKKIFPNKRG